MAAVPTLPNFGPGPASTTQLAQLVAALRFAMNPPSAVLRQNTVQSVPNGAFTAVTFDVEDADTANGHDNTTNPSRYTAQYPGRYQLSGGPGFAANAAGRRLAEFAVNGTALNGSAAGIPGNAAIIALTARTIDVYLNVGDYVELRVYQDTGGALNTYVLNTDQASSMSIRWVSN